MIEMTSVFNAQYGRMVPNSLAYDSPRDRDRDQARYAREIQALGRDHPNRIPLYCSLLAEVAAVVNGDPDHDLWTIPNIADLAMRLDRPHRSCTAEVLAAFPKTEAVRKELAETAGECLAVPRRCLRGLNPPLR